MKSKLIFIFFIITAYLLAAQPAEAEGIILADDDKILEIFRDGSQNQIIDLAGQIKDYDKVILHLGARRVFSRGHPFFYKTSRANLKTFSEQLQKQKQDFYIWFLDSFGSEMFLELYDEHQQIVDANYQQLKQLDLDYQGIIIDLEWINLDTTANQSDNQTKYLEILKYLRNKFKDKELYAFMSIIDDQQENLSRGYKEEEIMKYLDNIVVMLYLKDAGFYTADNELNLILRDNRIDDLKDYYKYENYQIAVSLEGGIFLERNDKIYFIKTTNEYKFTDQSQLFYSKEEKYYQISGYKPQNSISIKRNDGQLVEINEKDRLHFLKIKADALVDREDYIWEYFQLQQ
ncbi:MAG: hypothetical protein ACOCQA_03585 [bacterium]